MTNGGSTAPFPKSREGREGGVHSVRPSGGEAGGPARTRGEGKGGPRAMTVDGGRSAPAMAREWWAQLMVGGAIEVGSFGPAQDEHNGFPFIQKKFK
jgi:hypothetical protein